MAELPDVAFDQLGGLYRQSVATLSLPVQALLNVMCLLGKKAGGSRTIVACCSFYREIMKLNGFTIRERDLEHGHRFDSALAGCSSLRAAVLRALKIENATAHGKDCAHMLWDMDKFYDSINLLVLAKELLARAYP